MVITNILVPFDGSTYSVKAFNAALDIAQKHDARISILTCLEKENLGAWYVDKKVRMLIHSLERDAQWMPWLDDVKQQIENNKKYWTEKKKDTGMYNYEGLIQYGKEWANEMAKLPVYNKLQYHAREAAIKLGNLKVWDALEHLHVLEEALDAGFDEYSRRATEYNLDTNGNINQYTN